MESRNFRRVKTAGARPRKQEAGREERPSGKGFGVSGSGRRKPAGG